MSATASTNTSDFGMTKDPVSGNYSIPDVASPGERMTLRPEQALSRTREFRSNYPELAAYFRPKPFAPEERDVAYSAGAGSRGLIQSLGRAGSTVGNMGTFPAAAIGSLVGALGGAALGKAKGFLTGDDASARYALLAALAGLGAGGYLGYNRTKQAASRDYKDSESPDALRTAIAKYLNRDSSVSASEKMDLIAGLQRLSLRDLQTLKRQLATAGGAAAGALVARFVFGSGWLASALGAAAGGWAANRIFSPSSSRTVAGSPFGTIF